MTSKVTRTGRSAPSSESLRPDRNRSGSRRAPSCASCWRTSWTNQPLLLGRHMSHLSEDRFHQLVSAERARDAAPLNTWESIAQRAREEGLIREHRTAARVAPWLRTAAPPRLL